jgi:hypothetical protein
MVSTDGRDAVARRGPARVTVAGVAGGVGATTVARAIAGVDRGVFTGRPVDVLVCRATGDSLVRASRATHVLAAAGHQPVVAVTAADASGPTRPVTARLRLLEPHTSAVVVLPFVRRWRELAVPLDDVRDLLTRPLTELPRQLRRYATAARELRAAVGAPLPASTRRTAAPLARPVPTIGRTAR